MDGTILVQIFTKILFGIPNIYSFKTIVATSLADPVLGGFLANENGNLEIDVSR